MVKVKDKKAGKLTIGMRCGDCLHFKTGPKSPLYKDKCSELGTKNYAKACQGFTPNFTALNRSGGSLTAAAKVARLTEGMNVNQKRILGYLLTKQSTQFSKLGVAFGQPMYVFLEPTVGLARAALDVLKDDRFDYLENYYKAYVIGTTNLGEGIHEVFLSSSVEGKPDFYFSVNVKEGSKFNRALTQEQFEVVRDKMRKDKRRRMPKALRKRLEKLHEIRIAAPSEDEEDSRTIDDVPYEWWENAAEDGKKGKGKKRNKGVSLHTRKKAKFKDDGVDVTLGLKRKKKASKKKVTKKVKGKKSTRIRLTK